jgi:hypothetical protein
MMPDITLESIIAAEARVEIDQKSPYLRAYPEIIRYFRNVCTFTRHEFIVGAHIVYGWMPTILEISSSDDVVDRAADILNRVRQGGQVDIAGMDVLKAAINNSVVGVSKVLHFLKPDSYPIWDSVVYKFINGTNSQYRMGKVQNYLDYVSACRQVAANEAFLPAYKSMKIKIGYDITKIRAIEMIMYVSAAS